MYENWTIPQPHRRLSSLLVVERCGVPVLSPGGPPLAPPPLLSGGPAPAAPWRPPGGHGLVVGPTAGGPATGPPRSAAPGPAARGSDVGHGGPATAALAGGPPLVVIVRGAVVAWGGVLVTESSEHLEHIPSRKLGFI